MMRQSTARQQPARSSRAEDLLFRAIAGVVNRARDGDLPAFATSLVLPRREWRQLQECGFPEAAIMAWTPGNRQAAPRTFSDLVGLMMANRTAEADARHALWLAHAIAVASHGDRHLVQELGVADRDEVSSLLETYFGPLAQRNTRNQKWKRFLFAELGAAQGKPELRPPGCGKCDHLPICFPNYASSASLDSSSTYSAEPRMEVQTIFYRPGE